MTLKEEAGAPRAARLQRLSGSAAPHVRLAPLLAVVLLVLLPLIELLLVEILRHEVRHLDVVQIPEREVGVPVDPNIGQAQDRDVATAAKIGRASCRERV